MIGVLIRTRTKKRSLIFFVFKIFSSNYIRRGYPFEQGTLFHWWFPSILWAIQSYIIGKLGRVSTCRFDDELARLRKCSSFHQTIVPFFLFQWIRKLLIRAISEKTISVRFLCFLTYVDFCRFVIRELYIYPLRIGYMMLQLLQFSYEVHLCTSNSAAF